MQNTFRVEGLSLKPDEIINSSEHLHIRFQLEVLQGGHCTQYQSASNSF